MPLPQITFSKNQVINIISMNKILKIFTASLAIKIVLVNVPVRVGNMMVKMGVRSVVRRLVRLLIQILAPASSTKKSKSQAIYAKLIKISLIPPKFATKFSKIKAANMAASFQLNQTTKMT